MSSEPWDPTEPLAGRSARSTARTRRGAPVHLQDATGTERRAGIQARTFRAQAADVPLDPGGVVCDEALGLEGRSPAGEHDDDLTVLGHGQAGAARTVRAAHHIDMLRLAAGRRALIHRSRCYVPVVPQGGLPCEHDSATGGRGSAQGMAGVRLGCAFTTRCRRRRRTRDGSSDGCGTMTAAGRTRGDSSAGRASAWHAEGPGFKSPSLHHPDDHPDPRPRRGSPRRSDPFGAPRRGRVSSTCLERLHRRECRHDQPPDKARGSRPARG